MPQPAAPVGAPPSARAIRPASAHGITCREQLGLLERTGRHMICKDAVYAAHGLFAERYWTSLLDNGFYFFAITASPANPHGVVAGSPTLPATAANAISCTVREISFGPGYRRLPQCWRICL